MKDEEVLLVATGSSEAEHRVLGSRFIALARPATTLEAAVECRDAERSRFRDATHHVYAVRLAGGDSRFDDDGEPSGTGGRPVLGAIDSAGLRDVAVVVTRYFGGTRLGTGGLTRAYGAAAALALGAAPRRAAVRGARLRVTFSYEDTGAVSRVIERFSATRLEEEYDERVVLVVAVPVSEAGTLARDLAEETAGRAHVVSEEVEVLVPRHT